ncbi:MAG: amidohydrolase, partial [Marmoricola sp.]|nr:amidohydrolase [Marmoricola sp.]
MVCSSGEFVVVRGISRVPLVAHLHRTCGRNQGLTQNRRVSSPGTAFVNASLFDGHRYLGPTGEAVVVRDGRIASVGEVPAGAEVVDVQGGLLSPGFVDAHVHAVQGGLELTRCNLAEGRTREDYLATIAAYAASHPELPWILGGGWAMAAFPGGTPTAADLDAVVPDRPVFLPNRDHHGAWVNSRAMEVAGITRDSPEPPHGRYERDADGRPTGTLHEGAMDVVAPHLPHITGEQYYAGLLAGQAYLHSLGVTGWQDAIVGEYGGMDDPGPTYLEAARRGDLTAHVVGALWWDRDAGEEQVGSLVDRRASLTHGRFRATSIKVMQDGVAENFTAALTSPYLDRHGRPTGNSGHSFVEPEALRRYVARLDAEGFQVHVHAIGDRAVREALDAFEGLPVDAQDRSLRRHHVAHLQVVHPDDAARFGALGIAANLQALWACLDDQMVDLTLPFLGEERAAWQYPFAALHRGGAPLVAGSDWPVSTPNPLEAIHVAVNRWAHG